LYELKPLNIRVKLIQPGVVKTSLYDSLDMPDENIHREYMKNFSASHTFLSKNIQKGLSPEVSAKTIYQAATDKTWKLHYKSGSDTKLVALLRTLLPLNIFMLFIEKMAGTGKLSK
jgi:short-subunit dehydrogenase